MPICAASLRTLVRSAGQGVIRDVRRARVAGWASVSLRGEVLLDPDYFCVPMRLRVKPGDAMGRLMQDLRYAIRTFRKQPGFTITAIATLALGIGANAAIFTVVDSTLLRPLPFPDYERLMEVSLTLPRTSGAAWNVSEDMDWSYPKFETFRQSQRVFDRVAVYASKDFTLTGAGDAEMVTGETVSAEYLSLLGITAELGRTFVEREDAAPESARVAILGHSLWERRFGRDPGVIGRAVTLDTEKYIVVGVLPAGFRGLTSTAELWVPTMAIPPDALRQRWDHWLQMIARLEPGATPEEAKSAVRVLGRQVDEAHPSPIPGDPWGAKARSMSEARVDPAIRKSVWILQGAVGFVLLIACANIANLLLARGNARSREIGIRMALGCGRTAIVGMIMRRALFWTGSGVVIGVIVSMAAARLLRSLLYQVTPDDPVTYIALACVLGIVALGAGMIPAWRASRLDPLLVIRGE